MARRTALGAVLAMLLIAAPATATVVPELGAMTKITSNGPGWAVFQLKQPVRFDLNAQEGQPAVNAKVKGSGRLVGFLLRHDGDAKSEPGLFGFVFDEEDHNAYVEPTGELSEANFEGRHFWVDLPAGVYRLYVLAEGPSSVELTLPGLGPAITVAADQPAAYKSVETPRIDTFPTTNSAVYGMGVDLATRGFVFTEVDAYTDASLVDHSDACEYPPGSDFSGSDAFTTGCPGSPDAFSPLDPDEYYIPVPPPGVGTGWGILDLNAAPGRYGLGGNVTEVSLPPDLYATTAWMSYGAPGLPSGYELNPPAPPAPKKAAKKHKAKRKCTAKRKRAHKCGAKRKHKH
jgi:hypothetical protein